MIALSFFALCSLSQKLFACRGFAFHLLFLGTRGESRCVGAFISGFYGEFISHGSGLIEFYGRLIS